MSPHPTLLAPSILAADHAELCVGLGQIATAGCRWVHLDIMDGHFVPNLSFGPGTVAALRAHNADLFFDTHLMLARPDRYIEAFADAGSQNITIHVEPEYDIAATLAELRRRGLQAGISLNPGTPAEALKPYLAMVDLVLVMTVWPGFGGQSFIADTLPKMRQLADWRAEQGLPFRLEVDGGINATTAAQCVAEGVDTLVAGTSFFKAPDRTAFRQTIEAL